MKPHYYLLLAASFVISSNAFADDTSALEKKIDKVFEQIDVKNSPGCAVGIIKNNKFALAKGYGLANLEHAIPLSTDSVFRMASVSKQFTAMAVRLLADEGKIDLEKDIRHYLPELKDYGHKVSVNAMIGHFAGMGDYDMIGDSYEGKASMKSHLKSAAGGNFRLGNEDYLSIKEFYAVVKSKPLRHEPNKKFDYSNFAYFLLSMLVEEVSGKTLRQYAEENMFKPLRMKHTFFSDDANEIVVNRASGYAPKEDKSGYETNMTNLFWVGDGGLHTNLHDMLIWDSYFYNPTLGENPKQFLADMNTPNSQFDSRGALYANGQFLYTKNGKQRYSHSGGWLGTSTYYIRIPEDKTSVAIMCNDVSQNPGKYAKEILTML